ncbi:hypothetical protein LTS18_001161, partial [Coniosporium uncinatum]
TSRLEDYGTGVLLSLPGHGPGGRAVSLYGIWMGELGGLEGRGFSGLWRER